jgi:hypothetical protein
MRYTLQKLQLALESALSPAGLEAYSREKAGQIPYSQHARQFEQQIARQDYYPAVYELACHYADFFKAQEANLATNLATVKRWGQEAKDELANTQRQLRAAMSQIEKLAMRSRIDVGIGEPTPKPENLRITNEELATVAHVIDKAIQLKKYENTDLEDELPKPKVGRPAKEIQTQLEKELGDLFTAAGLRANAAAKQINNLLQDYRFIRPQEHIETSIESRLSRQKRKIK